jgi:hypothetical protein
MDANNESGKAEAAAAAANGSVSAGLPAVESPNLAPGQSEPAKIDAGAASPKPDVIDHKVTTAVALFKGEHGDTPSDATREAWSVRSLLSGLQIPPLAAALVLTLGIGALAGGLGTLGVRQILAPDDLQTTEAGAFKDTIARLAADVAALKSSQDSAAKTAGAQLTRMSERIDRAERAQAEPATRLAKITEAVDRLERRVAMAGLPPATVAAAPAPTASATSIHPGNPADVTGTISNAPQATPSSNKDLSRLPVIQGWVLQRVVDGTAIIHSRDGMIEVGVGNALPGGGRVEAIRRQDGHWIVVTSRGLVLAR